MKWFARRSTPFQRWLEGEIAKAGNANRLSLAWDVPNPYVVGWQDGRLPNKLTLERLATLSGTPYEELVRLVNESELMMLRLRQSQRGTPRRGGSAGAARPLPEPEAPSSDQAAAATLPVVPPSSEDGESTSYRTWRLYPWGRRRRRGTRPSHAA